MDKDALVSWVKPEPHGARGLRTEMLAPDTDERWQRLVETSLKGGIFHHAEWLRLLRDQYRYPLRAHCVSDQEGSLIAGLPFALIRSRLTGTRLVALPFSDKCGPVLRGPHDREALELLLGSLRAEHAASSIPFEVRAPVVGLPRAQLFYGHELALEADSETVTERFNQNVRRGIRRAQREGVEVHRRTDARVLDDFYRLHVRTRRRQGVPTQPKPFIDRFARLFERGLGFVLVAQWRGQPVAAAVFLSFNGALTYKYGASCAAHLDKRPNHAIFSEAIRWGCEHRQRVLDFGRTEPDNLGLRAFKRAWGGREYELSYSALPEPPRSIGRGEVPIILKAVISRSPSTVGRAIGRALYRHVG